MRWTCGALAGAAVMIVAILFGGTGAALSREPAATAPGGESGAAAGDPEREVLAAEEAYVRAWTKPDPDAVSRMLAADFTYTSADAVVHPKNDVMSWIRSPDFRQPAVETSAMTARRFGDIGVVSGRWTGKAAWSGKETLEDFRFLAVWEKHDGRWRMVASQSTAIAPRPR